MNRCSILSLTAIPALALSLLPGIAVAQQKTLKDQLVGTWTVTSTLPNQLGFEGKRVITTVTADELKFTNTTAVGDLGPVVTSHRRAK
jgi:hypothetical protein